jgi:hypothetical protein
MYENDIKLRKYLKELFRANNLNANDEAIEILLSFAEEDNWNGKIKTFYDMTDKQIIEYYINNTTFAKIK